MILINLFILFFLQPIGEYFIHKKLHDYNVKVHIDHHKIKFNNYRPSMVPFIISTLGYYILPKFYIIWIIITKYQLVHIISHYISFCGKKHHLDHHKHWKYNYSFSIDGIWIDYIMNTKYLKT